MPLLLALSIAAGAATPSRAYLKAHRAHTEELVLYRRFGTALILRATLLTPAFRDRLAAERLRLAAPTPEDHAAFLSRMARDGADFHEVVFAADSGEASADRFGPGDDRWNLHLEADGRPQALVEVERVTDPTMLHRALYPQLNIWSELWIARFERTVASPRAVILRVGSGYGNGTLTWGEP